MTSVGSPLRIVAVLASAIAYLIGGYSASQNLWPWPLMRQIKVILMPSADPHYDPPQLFAFDQIGRLTGKVGSELVTCPQQDERTAVLLILGQSNAGNHGGQKTKSEYGSRVINFFDGRCYIAASPLLGSTGTWGEYWTETANLLLRSGRFETVVLIPAVVSNTAVARWAGDLKQMVRQTLGGVATARLTVTHVMWHQGEADAARGTREDDYRSHFLAFVASLRALNVKAPVYVSVATKCLLAGPHVEGNPIARAQIALAGASGNLRAGIDSDQLLGEMDRFDGCHPSGSGVAKMASEWAKLLNVP
jgi:Carbohydrate esterase, sialic acid-specific acetylesterase